MPQALRMACLLLALPAVTQAQTAFTPISNLGQPIGSGGDASISSAHSVAMSFTTGDTLTSLSTVSLSMISVPISFPVGHGPASSLGPIAVALYSDSSGVPGSNLTVLSGNNYPTNTEVYTYTNTYALLLMPNTTYWIVATSSASTGAGGYKWVLTSNTSLNSGSIWELGAANLSGVTESGLYFEFSVAVAANLPTTPLISSLPTASTISYGQTLASSTLSGGAATNAAGDTVPGSFAFTMPLTVPGAGTNDELVTFTPTDSADYYAVTTSVPVMVTVTTETNLPATPLISSLPMASTISSGQTLASSVLSGGVATNVAGATVAGSFAFTSPSTAPAVGTSSESVTFTPTDTNDYSTATIGISVTVIPFNFTVNTDGITITGYSGSFGPVTIPDTINGLPVIGIGTNAFYHSGLTSVTISTNVTSIGASAFAGCMGLVNVTIPDSVTNIGQAAFNVCSKLASVTLPDSLTTIEPVVFAECTALTNVTIPDSVTSIGESAFNNCYSVASVTIGSGVTNIGIQALSGFNNLTSFAVDPNNPAFCSVAGVLFDKGMTTLVQFRGDGRGATLSPTASATSAMSRSATAAE